MLQSIRMNQEHLISQSKNHCTGQGRQEPLARNCSRQSWKLSSHKGSSCYRIILAVLINLLLLSPVYCQNVVVNQEPTSSTHQNDTYTAPDPDSLNIGDCISRMDNTAQAVYVCSGNKELLPLMLYAERVGKETCEKTFKDELWNCSDFSILKEPKVTKNEVFRESSYMYALSFAAIAHTVTQACAMGRLSSCTCDEGPTHYDDNDVKYKHCSDEYGIEVAETFLRLRYSNQGKDLKDEMIDHIFEATKDMIRSSVSSADTKCKCYGVSGSCTMKTCYSELIDFTELAAKIKVKHDSACEVDSNGHSVNAWVPRGSCKSFTSKDLIFRRENDWCLVNDLIGARGVVGRVCDVNSEGSNSCGNLCRRCQKTPMRKTEVVLTERNCQFHFCCKITCEQTISEQTYHVCS